MGFNKSFPKNIIDGIIGRLEYDLKEDICIKRQLKIALFRKNLFSYAQEGFMWCQATQLYNYFLWNQLKNADTKLFDLVDEKADDHYQLLLRFHEENGDYIIGEAFLQHEFEMKNVMEKQLDKMRAILKEEYKIKWQGEFLVMNFSNHLNIAGGSAPPIRRT